ncbi:hypothetical protein Srot_2231 [Segniliparus rotundus DSM 44985]|uniref:Uncharacterized protein n=1 Tax=Segniliparus rotundus (strain ATCC BAA-972 / CDC 1076 / CIP 108378 / DSM 44985 / JCM 13578) TaxID=640132 RepID=D6ZA12_SEGRD|nr:hypothetical protein [Segniliparus rotundus]ADG98682.1 hypothetical protein Srot_2231 [Segniliparus rotundus DSM 44985]
MGDHEEPVVIDGHEITSRDQALAHVCAQPGFAGIVPPDAPDQAREQVRDYAEKMWQLGKLLDRGRPFVVTPEGVQKAVDICQAGAGHAHSAATQSEQVKSFLATMFGSCAQGQAYGQTVSEWMDRMREKAATIQAILNGVADGTQEIKTKAQSTDSEWACAFRQAEARTPDIGGHAGLRAPETASAGAPAAAGRHARVGGPL